MWFLYLVDALNPTIASVLLWLLWLLCYNRTHSHSLRLKFHPTWFSINLESEKLPRVFPDLFDALNLAAVRISQ
jgi:hypothetical protein